MSELRRLVAVLRQPGQEEDLAPQPSLRHLDLLVGQMREAGLAVALDADGPLDDVPPGVDLSVYRIAQEALTNALKHSGAKHVDLRIRCAGGAVEVAVDDDGRGPSASANDNGGHGLIGMRERVNLFGGRFEAGRRAHPADLVLESGKRAIVLTHPCHWDASATAKARRLAARVARRLTGARGS
jgi:signal transduction histidine kinase